MPWLNKNFYITVAIGFAVALLNALTLGFFGMYVIIFPISAFIYIFNPDIASEWPSYLTGCQGEECWGGMIAIGSILIFLAAIFLGIWIGIKTNKGEFNAGLFLKRHSKILAITIIVIILAIILIVGFFSLTQTNTGGGYCVPNSHPLGKIIHAWFKVLKCLPSRY
jgi:MFS-type transporter involved in bile tolerance (Atg22 family)